MRMLCVLSSMGIESAQVFLISQAPIQFPRVVFGIILLAVQLMHMSPFTHVALLQHES